MVFVNTRSNLNPDIADPPRGIPCKASDAFLAQFFSVFIAKNDFAGGNLDMDAIVSCFQTSSSLYHCARAIGALDIRNAASSATERREATMDALLSYRNSIANFRSEIQVQTIAENDSALWTSFFLGLFEVSELDA